MPPETPTVTFIAMIVRRGVGKLFREKQPEARGLKRGCGKSRFEGENRPLSG
jgi:hypothetical protein